MEWVKDGWDELRLVLGMLHLMRTVVRGCFIEVRGKKFREESITRHAVQLELG